MLIITYDIRNTKNRSKLSKYLERYGRRLQLSVFEVDQDGIISNQMIQYIEEQFRKRLKNKDSILIIPITQSDQKSIIRFGKNIQQQKQYINLGC